MKYEVTIARSTSSLCNGTAQRKWMLDEEEDYASYVFSTVEDMKHYLEFEEGQTCITLGYQTINDGGGGRYVIQKRKSNLTNVPCYPVFGELVAEQIPKGETSRYEK